jgi:GntR family transcriptional regulator
VRQATQLLVEERVLERRRGSGTYVNQAPAEVDLFSAGGTLASFARSGLPLESALVGAPRLQEIAADARNPFAGRQAFVVVRRSSLGLAPVLLEEMYFDPSVFVGLAELALDVRSLSELARERYLLTLRAAEQRFGVATLDAARAELLELSLGAVVLKLERTLDFTTAANAVYAELYCRTDQVLFSQRLTLGRSGSLQVAGAELPARALHDA